jgi:hypothetical protein
MNEQIKKDREMLDNAYNDFLSICTRAVVENSRTGVEGAIAFDRVKNYSDFLLAAQARVERARAVKIIEKYQQRSKEEYGKISIAPLDIYMMMQSEVDGAKQEILSDNN